MLYYIKACYIILNHVILHYPGCSVSYPHFLETLYLPLPFPKSLLKRATHFDTDSVIHPEVSIDLAYC